MDFILVMVLVGVIVVCFIFYALTERRKKSLERADSLMKSISNSVAFEEKMKKLTKRIMESPSNWVLCGRCCSKITTKNIFGDFYCPACDKRFADALAAYANVGETARWHYRFFYPVGTPITGNVLFGCDKSFGVLECEEKAKEHFGCDVKEINRWDYEGY